MRTRLSHQIWAIFGAILLSGALVYGYFISDQIQHDEEQNTGFLLLSEARIFAWLFLPYLESREPVPEETMARFTSGIDHRVTVIDARGVVLGDNRKSPELMDNHGSRPEIIEASTRGTGRSIRYSRTVGQNMLYVAVLVGKPGDVLGYVRTSVPLLRLEERLAELRKRILLSAGLLGGVLLGLGYLLSRFVANPIEKMTRTAKKIAEGRYDLRLVEDRNDELGELMHALNELASVTEERIEDITTNRNQLEAVLATMTEGLIVVDTSFRILHINDSARSMLSVSDEDLTHTPVGDIVRFPEVTDALENCLRHGTDEMLVLETRDQVLETTVVPLKKTDDTGGAIVMMRNITDLVRLEKVRSEFIANASHELKTPISAIRGYTETILGDSGMPAATKHRFLERVHAQVTRLDDIVQDLLQISRYDEATDKMAFQPVSMASLLSEVTRSREEEATDKRLTLSLAVPDSGEPLLVNAEEAALYQLFANLLDNAIKYTNPGGRVSIRLGEEEGWAVTEVEDDGIGIPDIEQHRIFERFYRVDRARSRELGGTGLGLSIVKHVVQAHGGTIQVRSMVDQGTVFTVRLPLAVRPA